MLALHRYLKQNYHLAFGLICEIRPKCAGTNLKYSFYKATKVFSGALPWKRARSVCAGGGMEEVNLAEYEPVSATLEVFICFAF